MSNGRDEPAVQHRRLRIELKNARRAAGKTQKAVAQAMDWSVSKLIRVERGEVKISTNDLKALLAHYRITDSARIDLLLQAAKGAKNAGEARWSACRDVHSSEFLAYAALESSASIIRNYEPLFVSGLLQTEEYNEAIQTEAYDEPPETVARRWEVREQRQKVHERDVPPKMSFILDEAALRRAVGGPKVMRRQLQRLRDWSAEPHISLQILPFGVGAYPGMGIPFFLLEFSSPSDPSVVYLEHAIERTVEDSGETGLYLTRFVELEKTALSAADSEALLGRMIRARR